MALRFVPAETIQVYMETLQSSLAQYGRPVALYSDQHSIFRVNQPDCDGARTQFTRALETLDIAPIHAHTPQAKGRVKRAHQTLQDRLVKELRLHGLSTLAAANVWLPTFQAAYNRRFAVAPASPIDAHRPVRQTPQELARIFALQHPRIISKTLSVQFQNRTYQLQGQGRGTACGRRRSPCARRSTARLSSCVRVGPYPIACSPRARPRFPSKPRKRSRSGSPPFTRPNAAGLAPNRPPTIRGADRFGRPKPRRQVPKKRPTERGHF